MRFKIFLLLALLFHCFSSLAQNTVTDTSATCVAYWQKGDIKELQITRSKQKIEAGKQKDISNATYGAIIKILDASDTSYTIEWAYKSPSILNDNSPSSKLYNLFLNLKIIYTTDETGIFDSLINYDEIKLFFDKSITFLGEQAADKEEFKKAAAQMKSIFDNKESIVTLVLREIMLYHSPYGVEYFSNNIQEGDTELPNVFGGDPFPAKLQLELLKQDATRDIAKISVRQQIDKEKAAGIMNEFFKSMASASKNPVDEKDMIKNLVIDDNSEFDLQLSSGWVQKLLFKREVAVGDSQNIETCEMKIKR